MLLRARHAVCILGIVQQDPCFFPSLALFPAFREILHQRHAESRRVPGLLQKEHLHHIQAAVAGHEEAPAPLLMLLDQGHEAADLFRRPPLPVFPSRRGDHRHGPVQKHHVPAAYLRDGILAQDLLDVLGREAVTGFKDPVFRIVDPADGLADLHQAVPHEVHVFPVDSLLPDLGLPARQRLHGPGQPLELPALQEQEPDRHSAADQEHACAVEERRYAASERSVRILLQPGDPGQHIRRGQILRGGCPDRLVGLPIDADQHAVLPPALYQALDQLPCAHAVHFLEYLAVPATDADQDPVVVAAHQADVHEDSGNVIMADEPGQLRLEGLVIRPLVKALFLRVEPGRIPHLLGQGPDIVMAEPLRLLFPGPLLDPGHPHRSRHCDHKQRQLHHRDRVYGMAPVAENA